MIGLALVYALYPNRVIQQDPTVVIQSVKLVGTQKFFWSYKKTVIIASHNWNISVTINSRDEIRMCAGRINVRNTRENRLQKSLFSFLWNLKIWCIFLDWYYAIIAISVVVVCLFVCLFFEYISCIMAVVKKLTSVSIRCLRTFEWNW